jgi:hypothetical protein
MANTRIYRHYGADKFDPNHIYTKTGLYKPLGLYASPQNSKKFWVWKNWCIGNEYSTGSLDIWFDFRLTKDAKVLKIRKPSDVKDYLIDDPNSYNIFDWDITDGKLLDLDRLYKDYDAMLVIHGNDYNELHFSHLFYGWDVDSICIWNLDKVIPL